MMLKTIGLVMAAAFIVLAVLDRNCWVISSGISLEKEEMKQQGCPNLFLVVERLGLIYDVQDNKKLIGRNRNARRN